MDVETLDRALLVGAAVLGLAILAVRLSARLGLPSLLAYLVIGVVLGSAGLNFDDAATAHALGFAALVVILTEGGLTTRWSDVRTAMPLGFLLSTVGVAVSTAIVAVVAHYGLGLDWTTALILGGIFASTDAAAVFSVLRRVPLRPRVAGALEAESGLNDAPTVLLVTLLATGAKDELGWGGFLATVAFELAAGSVIGLAVGFGGAWLLRRTALPSSGLYPLAVVTVAVLAYGGASFVHASGFAAVYLAALVLGNADLPHRPATKSFVEGLAWLAQIGLFVMLGLIAYPLEIDRTILVTALVVVPVTIIAARPMSVLVSCLPFRVPWREQAFLSVAGLRGAVPVVLATIPLSEAFPGSERVFDLVFIAVIVFTLVQTPPLGRLASVLGVVEEAESRDVGLEAAPLERVGADMLQLKVSSTSRLHGVEVAELRLPPGASVALVVRDEVGFVPKATTSLRHGDGVLVVAPHGTRAETERRLKAVSRSGRLAGWVEPPEVASSGDDLPLRWRPSRWRRWAQGMRGEPKPGD
ncbi:MAG: potassium/proton antiporter [Jiangellales bacterium]